MRPIPSLAWTYLVTSLRERETLFWFGVFPLLLLALLTLIFGRLGREGEMNFRVALVNQDDAGPRGLAAPVEEVFLALSTPPAEGKEPLFTLRRPDPGSDHEQFLAQAKDAVRLGDLHAVVVIPSGFTSQVLAGFQAARRDPEGRPSAQIRVLYREGNAASGMAASIIKQVLARLDLEFLTRAGLYREDWAVPARAAWIGGGTKPLAYVDFLLPGIILMSFFQGALFGVPGTILYARDGRILRRYWVTPLGVPQYLGGFALGYLGMCVLQFLLLFLVGRFGFGASVHFGRPLAILYLFLAAATFLSFGFLVAALAKTANAGMAIASIINMPMIFLSGLFFPVSDLPRFLQFILNLNPLSYLADGLRASLGTGQTTSPIVLTFLVPLGWLVACAAVAARRLRWDVGK